MDFWCKLLKCMKHIKIERSTADSCLYHRWSDNGLVLIASWIDDNILVGSDEAVAKTKNKLMGLFYCKDCGELEEYVRCKSLEKGRIHLNSHSQFSYRVCLTNLSYLTVDTLPLQCLAMFSLGAKRRT